MVAAPVKGMVPAEAKVLQSFLRFAVGDGQDALPDGYAPLPQAFRTRALATAGRLDAAKPAASPSPIPSGTAAPPVVPDDGGEAPVLDPGSDGPGDGGSGGGGDDLGGSGGGVDLTDGAVDGDVVTVAPGALPPVAQAPQVAGGPAQVALAASLVPASRARTLIPLLVGLTLLTLLGGPARSLLATRRRPTSAGA